MLREVSLQIRPGEAVGLVGESGSGKSMTARAIDRLLPRGADARGQIRFEGADVAALSGGQLRAYRNRVAMIFQDPRAHVNPVRRIGDFMTEALRTNLGVGVAEARLQAADMLGQVGIEDGKRCLRQYPHELSGGMLQRVMIAAALLTKPALLLADEPTTALDVTTQAEVMAILDELRRDRGLAMLFITHDLELAAAICDRTDRDVRRTGRRGAPVRTAAQRPAASLHGRPRRGPAGDRAEVPAAAGDPWPSAVGFRGACGRMRVRAAMPARAAGLHVGSSAAGRAGWRPVALHPGRRPARPSGGGPCLTTQHVSAR